MDSWEFKDEHKTAEHDQEGSDEALRCPNCGSHTVTPLELNKEGDSTFICRRCGNDFKHNVVVNPRKTSISKFADSNGQSIAPGQEYRLHSVKYKVPDQIKVVAVDGESIVGLIEGGDEQFPIEITQQDIDNQGYSFEPAIATEASYEEPEGVGVFGEKESRRQFSTTQQQELINESAGEYARNISKLDLSGTHYSWDGSLVTGSEDLDEHFLW